jgi:hypothetical protein
MLLSALFACAASVAQAKPGHPPDGVFFARPYGDKGIAIAHDVKTGLERFRLPAGMLSADGSLYAAAELIDNDETRLKTFDAATGDETLRMPLAGSWSLGAVSPNGKTVALTRVPNEKENQVWLKSGKWQTDLQIIDVKSYRPKHTIKLAGNFEVEALSPDGSSLFLVEHLPAAKPDRYVIRWYDLSKEQLVADPLRSKTADEIMSGYAWGGVASTDGEWLFTLYLSTNRKVAFVHMLNLKERYTVCVDLPSDGASFEALKHYALAYSPQRKTLFATNPRTGVVAEIWLDDYRLDQSKGKFVVNKSARFTPSDVPLRADKLDQSNQPLNMSVISPDNKRIFFSDGMVVRAYDIDAGKVSDPYPVKPLFSGLGVSDDGSQLFLARSGDLPAVVDVKSGRVLAESAASIVPWNCPITRPQSPPFAPPTLKPDLDPGEFWHGSDGLWTAVRANGTWSHLPFDSRGYTQKVFWWRKGYDVSKEPMPKLTVTGKRLDDIAPPFVVSGATNAFAADIGSAMLVGVKIPTAGCWEITGRYGPEELSFVVWVAS